MFADNKNIGLIFIARCVLCGVVWCVWRERERERERESNLVIVPPSKKLEKLRRKIFSLSKNIKVLLV